MHAHSAGTHSGIDAVGIGNSGSARDARQAGTPVAGSMGDLARGIGVVRGRAKAREEKIYSFAVGTLVFVVAFLAALVCVWTASGCATIPTHGPQAPTPDSAAWRCYVASGARCASEAAAAPPCDSADAACIAVRALAAGLCLERGYVECVNARESEK